MAFSTRNQLGNGGAVKLSALEAALPPADGPLYGAQPFGALDGRFYEIDSKALIHGLGTNWIYTEVGTNSVEALTIPTATLPPRVIFTSDANANSGAQLQFAAASAPSTTAAGALAAFAGFIPRAGTVIHALLRFRITTTIANSGLIFGLTPVDTTVLNAGAIGFTEGITLKKLRTVSVISGDMRVSSTSTATALSPTATVVIDTWHTIGFRLNGVTSVEYFFDGNKTGSTTMTNIPTAALCPSIAFEAGTAAAATIEISGVYFGQEVV